MEFKRTLNTDIPGSISELQAAMKQFILKHRLYRILLRGKGLEFETYRKYAPDDDSTTIDWKASRRANTTLVKQYRDERNLKVVFLVDVGDNMVFGSSAKLKCEYAAEVVASFSHLINTTGDRAGLVLFSNEVKDYIKPGSGTKHFSLLVDKLTSADTYGGATDLGKGLDFALDYVSKNYDSLIIVSDFVYFDKSVIKKFYSVSAKFETLALMVRDPLDDALPDVSGEVVIEDPHSGQQVLLNPKVARGVYKKITNDQKEFVRRACLSAGADSLELDTSKQFVPTLSEFLKERLKLRGRK